MPLSTAQSRVFGSPYLSQVAVTIADEALIDTMKTKITNYFYEKFNITDSTAANFSVISSADTLSTITSVT